MLRSFILHHNNELVPGTRYKRKDVNGSNFYDFMTEKTKIPSFENFLTTNRIDGESIKNRKWLEKMFEYRLGERVYISLRLSPGAGDGSRTFHKASTRGYFNIEDVFVIHKRYLATSSRLTLLQGINERDVCYISSSSSSS